MKLHKSTKAWRELIQDGLPEFVFAKPMRSSGVQMQPGDPFPGAATERRIRLLYEQHKISPVVAEQLTTEPKAKAKKKKEAK
jgi:hypothetical protein